MTNQSNIEPLTNREKDFIRKLVGGQLTAAVREIQLSRGEAIESRPEIEKMAIEYLRTEWPR